MYVVFLANRDFSIARSSQNGILGLRGRGPGKDIHALSHLTLSDLAKFSKASFLTVACLILNQENPMKSIIGPSYLYYLVRYLTQEQAQRQGLEPPLFQ